MFIRMRDLPSPDLKFTVFKPELGEGCQLAFPWGEAKPFFVEHVSRKGSFMYSSLSALCFWPLTLYFIPSPALAWLPKTDNLKSPSSSQTLLTPSSNCDKLSCCLPLSPFWSKGAILFVLALLWGWHFDEVLLGHRLGSDAQNGLREFSSADLP